MIRYIRRLMLLCASLLLTLPAYAEQFEKIAALEVHYSSFPSTFLTPDIAQQYNIQRSRYNGVVNITVIDTAQAGKPAVAAVISGKAKNLIGQEKKLSFREIREGNAIYYIAEIKHANEERFTFTIDVSQQGTNGTLDFQQTFYVD
ncbi:DUF4426 domain-containing protein [Photobacterium japonica]|uniref:DUF4426 domain-containing protein n=1 Tax=Photobacterium japonica TaxID=2910235 RepID=UPI003D148DBD